MLLVTKLIFKGILTNKILVLVLGFNTFLSRMQNAKENLNYPLAPVQAMNRRQLLELHLYQSAISVAKESSRVLWAFVNRAEERALSSYLGSLQQRHLWEICKNFSKKPLSAASLHLCKDQFKPRVTDTLDLQTQQPQVAMQTDLCVLPR